MSLTTLGLFGIYAGVISKVLFDYTGQEQKKWSKKLSYTRTSICAGIVSLIGIAAAMPLVLEYFENVAEQKNIELENAPRRMLEDLNGFCSVINDWVNEEQDCVSF